jgi:hypothetical protein
VSQLSFELSEPVEALPKAEIPMGFRRVTHDEFFSALEADPRDIMPNHGNPNHTTWETQHRHVWGWTSPGWKNPGAEKIYALA